MIVEPGFLDHWKVELLRRLLDSPLAPIFVLRIWEHCQLRKGWEFDLSPEAVASICRWTGDPKTLMDALTESQFIRVSGRKVIIHDWDKSNRSLIAAWANGAKGGRPGKRKAAATKDPPMPTPPPADEEPLIPPPPPEPPQADHPRGEPIPAKTIRMNRARPVLLLLNEQSGRQFRETEANLLLIASRLEEKDVDVEGVFMMVRRQCAKWKNDPKMSEYLRPETLFGKTKFEAYYANRNQPIEGAGVGSHGRSSPAEVRRSLVAGADDVQRQAERTAARERQLAESGADPW